MATASAATAILSRGLPETCLLRATVADVSGSRPLAEVDSGALAAAFAPEDDEDEGVVAPGTLVAVLRGDGARRRVEVVDLGEIKGAPAGPVFALHPHHAADKAAGLRFEEHRFHPAKSLVPEGGASDGAVTQNVKRCRAELAELYAAIHGDAPSAPLLIKSPPRGRGYRLDPTAVMIKPGEDGANH